MFPLYHIHKEHQMKKNSIYLILGLVATLAGCNYDNYDDPDALLKGRIVYEGLPIGVRTDGPQLELWQDGFEVREVIPVYIAQDGTFSASLFGGEYKLVRKNGGPWVSQLDDTLVVNVKGVTELDVPVTPFFTISGERFQRVDQTIVATFQLDQIVDEADIESVKLYLGYAILTDENKNEADQAADLSAITIGQGNTLSVAIPESLLDADYLFARIGVRSTVSGEFYYTQVQKVDL